MNHFDARKAANARVVRKAAAQGDPGLTAVRRAARNLAKRQGAAEAARAELVTALREARALNPSISLATLAEAAGVTRARVFQWLGPRGEERREG